MANILTLAQARQALSLPTADTTHDAELSALFIPAADKIIEDICGPVLSDTRTETRDGGRATITLTVKPASITSVTVNDVTLTAGADYVADLSTGVIRAGSTYQPSTFAFGRQNVVVVYAVGMASIPENLIMAASEQLRFAWQTSRQGPRSPRVGQQPQAMAYTPSGYAVPKAVIEWCGPNALGDWIA